MNNAHGQRSVDWGNRALALAVGLAIAHAISSYAANDEPERPEADSKARKRMGLLQGEIEAFRVVPLEASSSLNWKIGDRPLLRYHDQSREAGDGVKGVLDAAVWRLGPTGRPKALVTLEIYLVERGNPLLNYEFVSLTSEQFELTNAHGLRWKPRGTEVTLAVLEGAPPPADSAKRRLAQMRDLARRFTVEEELGEEKINCRLMPQPIDRYNGGTSGILDGAVFVFANGTNPEMGLILECSTDEWSYGVIRLSAAKLFAQLDGKNFLESTQPAGTPVDAPYAGSQRRIALPE
jgi:hypothetical protein